MVGSHKTAFGAGVVPLARKAPAEARRAIQRNAPLRSSPRKLDSHPLTGGEHRPGRRNLGSRQPGALDIQLHAEFHGLCQHQVITVITLCALKSQCPIKGCSILFGIRDNQAYAQAVQFLQCFVRLFFSDLPKMNSFGDGGCGLIRPQRWRNRLNIRKGLY